MMRVVLGCMALVAVVELIVLVADGREHLLRIGGAAVACGLVAALLWVRFTRRSTGREVPEWSPQELLDRWVARTDTTLRWADGSRRDWDRHLRPLLAREFQMATRNRQNDRAAFHASGVALFGADLWEWVDPSNVSPVGEAQTDSARPGPGRGVLDAILERLEQL